MITIKVKGLVNLIALLLQGKALENKNSCFIDPANEMPFEDQFNLLKNIQRVSVEHLDNILYKIENPAVPNVPVNSISILADQNGIPIILNKQILIQRKQLTPELIIFLREKLNFLNSDYIIKKKLGKNTFSIQPYFKMLEE